MQSGVSRWIRPEKLIKTHSDSCYSAILHFVFPAGPAKDWKASSRILFPDESYCRDGETKGDHRPVEPKIELP